MPGLISFFLILLVLCLLALASVRKSFLLIRCAAGILITASVFGWYHYIFPAGITWLFFAGSMATIIAISGFIYAIYSLDWVLEHSQSS